jgi:hypothetical protein
MLFSSRDSHCFPRWSREQHILLPVLYFSSLLHLFIWTQTWKIVVYKLASCAAILFIYVRSRSGQATIFRLKMLDAKPGFILRVSNVHWLKIFIWTSFWLPVCSLRRVDQSGRRLQSASRKLVQINIFDQWTFETLNFSFVSRWDAQWCLNYFEFVLE